MAVSHGDRSKRCAAYAEQAGARASKARHFAVELTSSGVRDGHMHEGTLREQWRSILQPLLRTAHRIRLFGNSEGVRGRLASAHNWSSFFAEATRWLPKFAHHEGTGREEFEVDAKMMDHAEAEDFWIWCLRAGKFEKIRLVAILDAAPDDVAGLFAAASDPRLVSGIENTVTKEALRFAQDECANGERFALVCTHALASHYLCVFANPATTATFFELAMQHSTLSEEFLALNCP